MSSDLDSSVAEYMTLLKERCPKVSPSIFPSSYNPRSIDQLCSTTQQIEELSTWLQKSTNNDNLSVNKSISFPTVLHFEKREIEIIAIKV